MNIENIKAYLKIVLTDSRSKGDIRVASVMIWVLSVCIGAGGLSSSEPLRYRLGIALFALSSILVIFSFIVTCKLTLKNRLIHNAVFFTVTTVIFDIGCFIFFESAGLSRPLNILICWIPLIVAVVSVIIMHCKTQKGTFTQKSTPLITIVAGAVGGGIAMGRYIRVPDVEFNSETEMYTALGVALCVLSCVLSIGITNWLTFYYVKALETRGFEIKDGDFV